MSVRIGPQYLLARMVMMSPDDSRRVRALVARLGVQPAREALRISEATLDAARDCGRMQAVTREKVLAALDRIEAER